MSETHLMYGLVVIIAVAMYNLAQWAIEIYRGRKQ